MGAASTLAIEASGLEKSFGTTRAVRGVDLAVQRGSVYGILGPNGAGKTTTIKMLATLVRPDAGEARVLGYDIVRDADAVRGAISLTGQLASVDEDLTGNENLILLGRLLGFRHSRAKARAAELLDADRRADAAGILARMLAADVHLEPDAAALSAPSAEAGKAAEAVGELSRSGIAVATFSLGQPTLDEVFLALTGHPVEHDEGTDVAPAIERRAA